MSYTYHVPSFHFFLGAVSEMQRSKVFPTWLPHHVTYDIIIINRTFYVSSRSNGENLVSIRQAVAEKNKSSLRTNKQTDPNATPNPSAEVTRKRAIRDCRPSPELVSCGVCVVLCGVCVLVCYIINKRHNLNCHFRSARSDDRVPRRPALIGHLTHDVFLNYYSIEFRIG